MKVMLFSILPMLILLACSDKPEPGPVPIYYGQDICERCNMIISEKKFAAQYKTAEGAVLKFDDTGCMLHYLYGKKDNISDIYVMDYVSYTWTDAQSAHYVWSNQIMTPMGYGIAAVGDVSQARMLAEKENGVLLGGLERASEKALSVNNNK